MDTCIEKLLLAFKLATSSNHTELKEAEKYIEERKAYPNYLKDLILITTSVDYSYNIKQLAAIQLKNFIETYWKFGPSETENKALIISDQDRIIVISEEEKSVVRSQIVQVTGEFSDKSIMKLFIEGIRKILKLDFVRVWQNDFLNGISILLDSKNESKVYCALSIFYQLSKLYEYESGKNRAEYDNAFNKLINYFSEYLQSVFDKLNNDVCLIILKKLLKIVHKTINSDIPSSLASIQVMDYFIITILKTANSLAGVDKNNSISSDQMLSTNYWKVGLLCFQILFRIITKYSNPNITDSKKLKDLSIHLNKTYKSEILKTFFSVLEKSLSTNFPDKILCIIYKYLSHLIEKHSLVDHIVPHLNTLLSQFIVQNTVISKNDLSLRLEDEKNYIYKCFDIAQSFNDKRYACSSFIRSLCEYRVFDSKKKKLGNPEFLNRIFDFLVSMFNDYEKEITEGKAPNPLIKEALMHLFESISVPVLEHKKGSEIEIVLRQYMVPELTEEKVKFNGKNAGVIKEKAIFVIKFYGRNKFTDSSLLSSVVELLCKCLQDDELPVRVVTSVSLPLLLRHAEVKLILENYIKNLLLEYLKLMNQIDLEDLLTGLENIIENFGDKVTEFAVELTKELVGQFNRLNNTNIDEDNGESHLAAEGVIKTINRIIGICCDKSDLVSQVEIMIKPVLDYCLTGEGFEYVDEGIDIIRTLVTKGNFKGSSSRLSMITWSYFISMNFFVIGDEEENNKILLEYPDTGLEGIGYDTLEDHLSVLADYVGKDIVGLVNGVDAKGKLHIDRLFITLEQILKNSVGSVDVSNNVIVCRMFSQILDACTFNNNNVVNNSHSLNCDTNSNLISSNCSTDQINIDKYTIKILEYILPTILKTKTLTYKLGLYDTLCSSLLYNSKLTLDFLFNKGQLEAIMLKWFDFLESIKTEKIVNKNVYGLTSCLIQTTNFKLSYNLDPSTFILVLSKNIYRLLCILDNTYEKKLQKKGVIDLNDSDDEVDMDKDFEEKLKKAKKNMEKDDDDQGDDDDISIPDDIDQVDYMLSEEWYSNVDKKSSFIFFNDFLNQIKSNDQLFLGLIMKEMKEESLLKLDTMLSKYGKSSK